MSPDGSQLFLFGDARSDDGDTILALVSLDAATGGVAWVREYASVGSGAWMGDDLAISADGSTVFALVDDTLPGGRAVLSVGAYAASDGTPLWQGEFNDPSGATEVAWDLELSPDGRRLFVAGGSGNSRGFLAIGIDATTGAQEWLKTYDPVFRREAGYYYVPEAFAAVAHPTRQLVYILGPGRDHADADWVVVAYRARSGERAWVSRFDSGEQDHAEDMVVTPGRRRVLVFGLSGPKEGRGAGVLASYDARSGRLMKVTRFGETGADLRVRAWESDLEHDRFFLAGTTGSGDDRVYSVAAYRTTTGRRAWLMRYREALPLEGRAWDIAMSPDGSMLYSTGAVGRLQETAPYYLTIALVAESGRQAWTSRHAALSPMATSGWIKSSPTSDRVFAFQIRNRSTGVIAYDTN